MSEPTNADLLHAILDLHAAMDLGFKNVDQRFGGVETRLTSVEGRLTSVEGEVRGIRYWMERTDQRLAALEAR